MEQKKSINLSEKAQEILRIAEQQGVEQNFFFITAFQRYQVQIQLLMQLENHIRQDGALVEKEYVKGRKNVYTHPAIAEYNRTATAANQTVQTLIKILNSMRDDESRGTDAAGSAAATGDKLVDFLLGRKK